MRLKQFVWKKFLSFYIVYLLLGLVVFSQATKANFHSSPNDAQNPSQQRDRRFRLSRRLREDVDSGDFGRSTACGQYEISDRTTSVSENEAEQEAKERNPIDKNSETLYIDGIYDGPGILQTLGGIALAFLPGSTRLSHREHRNMEENRNSVSNLNNDVGVSEILRDAPSFIRLAGNLCTPFISRATRVVASTFQHDHDFASRLMKQARDILARQPAVIELLGAPLSMAKTPFEEKSTITQGKRGMEIQVELSFTLSGSKEAGVAYLVASSGSGIESLTVTGVRTRRSFDLI